MLSRSVLWDFIYWVFCIWSARPEFDVKPKKSPIIDVILLEAAVMLTEGRTFCHNWSQFAVHKHHKLALLIRNETSCAGNSARVKFNCVPSSRGHPWWIYEAGEKKSALGWATFSGFHLSDLCGCGKIRKKLWECHRGKSQRAAGAVTRTWRTSLCRSVARDGGWWKEAGVRERTAKRDRAAH